MVIDRILGENNQLLAKQAFQQLKDLYRQTALYGHQADYKPPTKLIHQLEDIVATSAEWSYFYASVVLQGRFKKGEHAIKTQPGNFLDFYAFMLSLNGYDKDTLMAMGLMDIV